MRDNVFFFTNYLKDIYHQTCLIITALEKYSEEDFFNDEFCQNGFIRSLEVIGEASKRIPSEYREKYPEIHWRGMAGLRDVLIHKYDGIDTIQVWYVLNKLVPELNHQIAEVLLKFKELK